MSDQMDLLVEQVKMLAGEIAFSTSTLKRMVEQSVNEPDSSKTQVYLSSLLYHQTNVSSLFVASLPWHSGIRASLSV